MASDILELQEAKHTTKNAGNDQLLSVTNAEQVTNEQILAQQIEVTSNADTDVANNESRSDSLATDQQSNTPPQQSHQLPTQQTTPQQQQSLPQQPTSTSVKLVSYSLFLIHYLFKLVAFSPKIMLFNYLCDIHVYERFPKQVSFLVYYKNSIFHILKTVF